MLYFLFSFSRPSNGLVSKRIRGFKMVCNRWSPAPLTIPHHSSKNHLDGALNILNDPEVAFLPIIPNVRQTRRIGGNRG
jgi:hypothetical protein